jgi:hypothetical protein
LTLCIAGHPPPLVYRAAERRWRAMTEADDGEQPTNLPLGLEDISEWMQFGVELHRGDFVLCYTDSLIESHGRDGEMLGVAGLLKIANESVVQIDEPNRLTSKLLEAIEAQASGNLSKDDVTVLLFRPNAAKSASFAQRAFAPIRVLGAVIGSIFPGSKPAPWPEMSLANLGGAWIAALSRKRRRRLDTGRIN